MIIHKKLYINPMVDLSYVFRRFHEILRDEYNSFCEYCVFVKNKYIIYSSENLNISCGDTRNLLAASIKLSFLSDYPPVKSILGFKCDDSTYYLSNPGDADIAGVVHIFVKDCQHYDCQQEELNKLHRYTSSNSPSEPELRYLRSKEIWDNIFKKESESTALTKVISSGPATIAFWDDGTKTVVKCQEGDTYDAEKGILYAVLRKCMSNNKDYHNFLTEMDRFKTFVEEIRSK